MTALHASVTLYSQSETVCYWWGNPLIKIEAVQVVFYSHGQTGLRFCQMESKTQDLNISSRNRFYYLHKLLSFNYRKRPRKGKKKQQQKQQQKQNKALHKINWRKFIWGESGKYITRLLGQTDIFWNTFRLIIKLFIKWKQTESNGTGIVKDFSPIKSRPRKIQRFYL